MTAQNCHCAINSAEVRSGTLTVTTVPQGSRADTVRASVVNGIECDARRACKASRSSWPGTVTATLPSPRRAARGPAPRLFQVFIAMWWW